jgi:hypothetical protein
VDIWAPLTGGGPCARLYIRGTGASRLLGLAIDLGLSSQPARGGGDHVELP